MFKVQFKNCIEKFNEDKYEYKIYPNDIDNEILLKKENDESIELLIYSKGDLMINNKKYDRNKVIKTKVNGFKIIKINCLEIINNNKNIINKIILKYKYISKDINQYNLIYKSNKSLNLLKINKFEDLKICVLSVNFGSYDCLESDIRNLNNYNKFNWFYITDNLNNNKGWNYLNKLKYHNIYIKNIHNEDNNRMFSKFYKTQILNINFFKNFDYIIWIDASIVIENIDFINDIYNLIKKNLDHDFFIFEHSERHNIEEEYNASKFLKKYENQNLLLQIKKYYKNGYKNGLYESGFFIFKNNSKINNMMNDWWNEIQNYSYQCQISLPYILYKNNVRVYNLIENNFVKGQIMGSGSVWKNKLVGYVRNHR